MAYNPALNKPLLSFIKRLLRRKVGSRLGAEGAHAVREHELMAAVDWARMEHDGVPEVAGASAAHRTRAAACPRC